MSSNIAVVYGSVREARQGIKAANFMVNQLRARGHEVDLVDPKVHVLPMLDKRYFEYESGKAPEMMEKVAQIFSKADGYVIVTGEYNHSVPPALKNILDHYLKEYLNKPAAIVSYSGGAFGGQRAAVHLRAIIGQLGMVSIPSMFPIPAVQNAFDDDGNAIDKAYEKRVTNFIEEFEKYLSALSILKKQ